MAKKRFKITKRHYNIIIKQAADNLPEECGGFLGGKDGFIKAIFPLFNFHLFNKTDTFSFTSEDVDRAHRFFKKHGLDYYGLYHSHPSGVAEPSDIDIKTGHKYHFIIGIKDKESAVLRAFEIINQKAIPIPIQLIDKKYDVKNIKLKNKEPQNPVIEDMQTLLDRLDNIRHARGNTYKRFSPKSQEDSDFSTLA